jgi:hypothetical protein
MYVEICGDVITVVQDDERVPNHWAVERDCRHRE